MNTRKIQTTRFGEIETPENKILRFADGLPAFEDEREFILVIAEEAKPYIFMQSAVTPSLAFLLTPPFIFFPDYEFTLSDETVAELEAPSEDDLEIYVLVTARDIKHPTANLLAPVVINRRTNAAQQVVLDKTDYTTKHPLFPPKADKPEAGGK